MPNSKIIRTVIWAIAINALCILPSFLVGPLAFELHADIGLEKLALGFAFSGFWLVAALSAVPASRLVKRWGTVRSLQIAGFAAALATVVIAASSYNPITFVVLVSLSGVIPALATPAVNVVIISAVSPGRQTFALTAAGASPVVSLMVAGIAATTLGIPIGWRWIYVIVGVVALGVVLIGIRLPEPTPRARPVDADSEKNRSIAPLIWMMVGVAGANLAVGAATSFLVLGAPSASVDPVIVALLVGVASGVSIVFRLILATFVDRRRKDPFPTTIVLIASGFVGYVLLGIGTPVTYYLGIALVLVPGWSWVSLLMYGVLTRYRHDVTAAAGVVQMVFFVGGVIGPTIMGAVVAGVNFQIGWWVLALAVLIAVASVLFGRRRLPAFVLEH